MASHFNEYIFLKVQLTHLHPSLVDSTAGVSFYFNTELVPGLFL